MRKKLQKELEKMLSDVVDLDALPDVDRVQVAVNGQLTPLQIGDKLHYPDDSGILKTVISMTVFEDGTVNYMLKWFDGDFKTEMVSLTDLKILKQQSALVKVAGYEESK